MLGWWVAHWVEVFGFVTGAACVLLAWRRNVWNYPIGIVNTVLFIGLFSSAALYAQVGLQVVFLLLAITGWIGWTRARHRESAANLQRDQAFVASVPPVVVAGLVVTFVLTTFTVRWLLLEFTDSSVALADAATTAASLVAQFMLNRRWWQTWIVWIAVDIVYVWLYATSGLWITALLYAGFCVMCIFALRDWVSVRRVARPAEPELLHV